MAVSDMNCIPNDCPRMSCSHPLHPSIPLPIPPSPLTWKPPILFPAFLENSEKCWTSLRIAWIMEYEFITKTKGSWPRGERELSWRRGSLTPMAMTPRSLPWGKDQASNIYSHSQTECPSRFCLKNKTISIHLYWKSFWMGEIPAWNSKFLWVQSVWWEWFNRHVTWLLTAGGPRAYLPFVYFRW